MLLKLDTFLNVYQHKYKTILCRIQVKTSSKTNINGETQNTCRAITADEWKSFDRELESWLESYENVTNVSSIKDIIPNYKVRIRKSKISAENVQQIFKMDNECDGFDVLNNFEILDCILEKKSELANKDCVLEKIAKISKLDCIMEPKSNAKNLASKPSATEEYEPMSLKGTPPDSSSIAAYVPYTPTKRTILPGTTTDSASPPTSASYTPAKRTRRFKTLDTIKAFDIDTLNLEENDPYSPTTSTADYASRATYVPYLPTKRISATGTTVSSARVDLNTPSKRTRRFKTLDTIDDVHLFGLKSANDNTYKTTTNKTPITVSKYIATTLNERSKVANDLQCQNSSDKNIVPECLRAVIKVSNYKSHVDGEYIPKSKDSIKNAPVYKPTPIESKKEEKLTVPEEKYLEKGKELLYKSKRKGDECKKDKTKKYEPSKESNKDDMQKNMTFSSSEDDFEKVISNAKEIFFCEKVREKQKTNESRKVKLKAAKMDTPNDINKTKQSNHGQFLLSHKSSKLSATTSKVGVDKQEKCQDDDKTKSLKKSSPKNKELFGTDDEEDCSIKHSDSNNNAVTKSLILPSVEHDTKMPSISSSTKKKRKHKHSDKKKSDMDKLSDKKKAKSSNNDKRTHHR